MTGTVAPRWRVTTPVAAWLFGLGLLTAQPVLLVGAVVPLGYALYSAAAARPALAGLRAERSVEPATAPPGTAVTVTLTLRNTGDSVLPDVRVADGIPTELALDRGSATAAGALAPGEALTCRYTLTARAGEHDFGPATVRLRSVAGERPVTTTLEPATAGTLRSRSARQAGPDPPQHPGPGETATERRGGQEFFATREYRPGDAMGRIDWRHFAKTGEFVTQQYRDDRAGEIAILVDARPATLRSRSPGAPTGGEYAASVAEALSSRSQYESADTSIGAVGLAEQLPPSLLDPTGLAWIPARSSRGRQRAERLFDAVREVARGAETPPASGAGPSAEPVRSAAGGEQTVVGDGGHVAATAAGATSEPAGVPATAVRVADRLSPGAELVVCTPLLDDWPVTLVATLVPRDHGVTVVSPTVTDGGSPGARVAGLERAARIDRLEALGAKVVDWQPVAGIERALDAINRARWRGR